MEEIAPGELGGIVPADVTSTNAVICSTVTAGGWQLASGKPAETRWAPCSAAKEAAKRPSVARCVAVSVIVEVGEHALARSVPLA